MKKIPEFKSETAERKFWSTADSTKYFDWEKAKKTKFVKLKPTLSEGIKNKVLGG